MASALPRIKRRIRSIESTGKLTKAMELIAGARARKLERSLSFEKSSVQVLEDVLMMLLAKDKEKNSLYFEESEGKKISFVFGPSLGLSGGFLNQFHETLTKGHKEGTLYYVSGTRLLPFFEEKGWEYRALSLDKDPSLTLLPLVQDFYSSWKKAETSSLSIFYGRPLSTLYFSIEEEKIFPLKESDLHDSFSWLSYRAPLMDEDAASLLEGFLPQYLLSKLHLFYSSSSLAENIARRKAMEEANDNVDDLLRQLTIELNKERQNSITQEITEVISGSLN